MNCRQATSATTTAMFYGLAFATAALAQPHPQPAAPPLAPPAIKLLDAGDSPRTALRLAPKVGSVITLNLTMHMSQSSEVGAAQPGRPTQQNKQVVEIAGVTTTYTVQATVTGIGRGGDIAYELELIAAGVPDNPSVPPDEIEGMRQSLRTLIGLRCSGVISGRGISKHARVTPPGQLDPALAAHVTAIERLMEKIYPPLPVEPIGPGANWQVQRTLEPEMFPIKHTSVFKLTAFDDSTAQLTLDMRQHADPQPLEVAGLPPGAASLVSFESTGTGRITLQLDQLAPLNSTTTLINDTTVRFRAGQIDRVVSRRAETTTELMSVIGSTTPVTTQPATR